MLLSPAGVDALRTALTDAGYTANGIASRLGAAATSGVARNDFRAALRATEDRDPLGTLIRVFICEQTEPEAAVAAALAPLSLDEALAGGLVERHGDGLRMGLDLEPYADDWWVLADVPASARPGRPLHAEHVLGIGGATQTLIGATVRQPVETALDLGTGSGVQALHLGTHARRVTATDLSERALRFAATTAALNGQDWELLRGDLVAPVAGRRFDLVVSNPPFVVGPGTTTHVYRDSGRVGDAIGAELAAAAPGLLTEGGTMQYLANWVHVTGEDWGERVAGWFAGTGLDAWVIQREVADPMAYVNLWLTDVGHTADPHRAAAWLDWFDAHKVEAIGFGIVSLRRAGHADPVVRVEDLRQRVEVPLGDRVAGWFDRQDWLRVRDTEGLLAARYRAADGLQLRQEATMGDEGWAVDRQVLAMPRGLRWTEEIDPLVLALVGGADGRLSLRDQLALLAVAHDVPAEELAEAAGPIVAHLVERGFIEPVAD
ncbi:methyltransferase domain-containing protein [Micromonospora endolithica]|uniref:Methyltransferase domain-containing protein n=2 Tax=Micromonospora endolithica TaxID=230091 RepID=A0A3A9ZN84_9ACTN|nr:methyltransferase domain-containing protein [Micromonospora endolithica]TWJ23332.1 methyltransferase family protein [Micromonospora endolithica]